MSSTKWPFFWSVISWYSEVAPMVRGDGPVSTLNMKNYIKYSYELDLKKDLRYNYHMQKTRDLYGVLVAARMEHF